MRVWHLPLIALSSVILHGQVVTTVAGTDWLFPGDGQKAVNAPLSASNGPDLAVDAQGNLYLCDLGNAMVMRIGPDGIINVVAGNGIVFVAGDGGPAINASLYQPNAMTIDRAGAIYVADGLGTLRKVTPDGIIQSIAGQEYSGFGGDGGPATQALFNGPYGLAVDAAGSIYVADTSNFRIRKITPDGIVHTIAGTGTHGLSGDGGPATAAKLLGPSRLTLDGKGNIFFVDLANFSGGIVGVVRKIDANGIITTVAGGGNLPGDGVAAVKSSLVALAVAVDTAGNLFIADRQISGIRKVDTAGIVTTIAGSGVSGFGGDGGPALKAKFALNAFPSLALDAKGNIYLGDEANGRVRKIDTAGVVTTIAGNGLFHFSGNGGPATSATLYLPAGLAQDEAGNIFVSEPFYGRIRRITPDKTISVYAGGASSGYAGDGGPATAALLSKPKGVTVAADGSLVFADQANCVVRRIDKSGVINTIAGNGKCGYSGDGGPPLQASMNAPTDVAVDEAGNLAITEGDGNRIRVVKNGTILTLAGNGTPGYSGDGGSSLNALVSGPVGIRIYGGYLYFSDSGNNVIRRINPTSAIIQTVVGNGVAGYSGDNGPAASASLNSPYGLTFDGAGNLYIADAGNGRIRRVDGASGIITTVGGGGDYRFDGIPANLSYMTPVDVLVDAAGDLLFADYFFNAVRVILQNAPGYTAAPASIALTAQAGGVSTDQTINLSGTIPGLFYAAIADAPWLQVTPPDGAMPTNLRVTADASSLAPGSYNATITVYAFAKPSSQTIPVSLTVTGAGQPTMTLSPSSLQLSYLAGAPARTRPVSVSNAGGGSLPFTISVATASGGNWLKAGTGKTSTDTTATLGAFGSALVNITADPGQLPAGTYSGTVTVTSAALNQQLTVPVTMTVTSVQQTIVIPQTGLAFYAVEGSSLGSVLPQFFSILNTGEGQMPWSISGQLLSGGIWAGAFPTSGVTDAAQPLVPEVRIDIDPGGLNAGVYYGTVQVTAPNADNTPQFVSLELNILPPGSKTGEILQPSGLVFTGVAGGEVPGAQTILIQNTTGAPVTFTSNNVVQNQAVLFQLVPDTGTVAPSQPLRVLIQPNTKGLAAGVYRGTVTLAFSDGTSRGAALVLVLTPPSGVQPSLQSSVEKPRAAPRDVPVTCTPTTLVPIFTLLSDGQAIPAGWPGQVSVRVIDDCANPMTAGSVTATFSNGDVPLRLTSLKDGTWAGTWTSRHAQSQVVITAAATIPEQNLAGQVSIKIGLQGADRTPVINAGGVVNAASFQAQTQENAQPLAPGSLIALFGSQLADSAASATSVPLPSTLGGGSIVIGGKATPLLYASDGQVNAVVPYGIPTNATVQVLASRGSSISVPQPIVIAPAAPGIFTTDGTQAIAVDLGNNILKPGNPAKAGDNIVIYCTGLGEVDPPVVAGQAASLTTLSHAVAPVTITIGGIPAQVVFAGLTPSATGLYQVNAVVPAGVTPGNSVPVVLTAASQVSVPATIAVR